MEFPFRKTFFFRIYFSHWDSLRESISGSRWWFLDATRKHLEINPNVEQLVCLMPFFSSRWRWHLHQRKYTPFYGFFHNSVASFRMLKIEIQMKWMWQGHSCEMYGVRCRLYIRIRSVILSTQPFDAFKCGRPRLSACECVWVFEYLCLLWQRSWAVCID